MLETTYGSSYLIQCKAVPSFDNGLIHAGAEEQEHRLRGPQSKQAEACIRNCIPTCIRGGGGTADGLLLHFAFSSICNCWVNFGNWLQWCDGSASSNDKVHSRPLLKVCCIQSDRLQQNLHRLQLVCLTCSVSHGLPVLPNATFSSN